ncbi:hypothetical protein [Streptomyces sp. URMC 129]|uniref:hypothetical protein n=1 Tax=Streptomyces sp. URMC 129 TaxID=3423407 RepID=UPI003F1DAA48
MSARHDGGPGGVREERLRLLAAESGDQGDAAVLTTGLQRAAAERGGPGGMAHLRAGGTSLVLHLVASTGLPRAFTREWENIKGDSSAPPGGSTPGPDSSGMPPGTGTATAPLPGPGEPVGSLSVLVPSHREPGRAGRAFLTEVARLTAERIRLASPMPGNLSLPRCWGTRHTADGTYVRTEQRIPAGTERP